MPFNIIRDDITKLRVDAIVNAAITSLQMGGGVCGAIFRAAGAGRLQNACNRLAPIKTGEAVITPGFDLPARHIIHTAGPVWRGGGYGEEALLYACYKNSLDTARQHRCDSIAFPLISGGIYGYPKADALRVATAAIRDFTGEYDMDVSLAVFDKAAFAAAESLLGKVQSYIDEHYAEERIVERRASIDAETAVLAYNIPAWMEPHAEKAPTGMSLDDAVSNLDDPFAVILLRLIDATGKKDAEIYRRANIDRRLFSKIRSNEHYVPSKATVLAFAIALELSLQQTEDLLARAGFALSHSRKSDIIVGYFIANRKYDIFEINTVLFSYDQPLLGG